MDMDADEGAEIIRKAVEKHQEEKAWQLYLMRYQNMTEDTYVSFDKFYNPNREEVENKTAEEILAEVKNLLDANEWG